jgi:hypothetical protein
MTLQWKGFQIGDKDYFETFRNVERIIDIEGGEDKEL